MNNIWKFSLFTAFSVIIDQLIKGAVQTILSLPGKTEPLFGHFGIIRDQNFFFIFGLDVGVDSVWSNRISLLTITLLLMCSVYYIVKWRNKFVSLGWSLSFIFSSMFSSWLDRYSQGFSMNTFYLGKQLTFSFLDVFLLIGAFMFTYQFSKSWQEIRNS